MNKIKVTATALVGSGILLLGGAWACGGHGTPTPSCSPIATTPPAPTPTITAKPTIKPTTVAPSSEAPTSSGPPVIG
jgi:hypothetical protein